MMKYFGVKYGLFINALAWVCTFAFIAPGGDGTLRAQGSSVDVLGYTISFDGVRYDPDRDESTWTYEVIPTINAYESLSYWVLELCLHDGHIVTDHSHDVVDIGTDSETGITGIKFHLDMSPFDRKRSVSLTIEGDWAVDDRMVGGKAGPVEYGALVDGPSCDPVECVIHYSTSRSETHFRLLRPGVYAMKINDIELFGKGEARVVFHDFGYGTHVLDPSRYPVHYFFGIGDSLEAVETSGWLTAEQMNEHELIFSRSDIESGVVVPIWMRVELVVDHVSSEYEGVGRVSIVPECG